MAFGKANRRGEMNVTPLVDIVLVLIVIFLVAMPVALRHIDAEVPPPAEAMGPLTQEPVVVEVKRSGIDGQGHIASLTVNGVEVARTELATVLRAKLLPYGRDTVFVDFDDGTRYGDAVSILDVARGTGAAHVALRPRY